MNILNLQLSLTPKLTDIIIAAHYGTMLNGSDSLPLEINTNKIAAFNLDVPELLAEFHV
jgi:hypothetical protein